MIKWYNTGTIVKINGSPVDTSGSSINIYIKGNLNLDKDKIIEEINNALQKHGIKRKAIK
jgi:hypothetical protein